MIVNGVTLPDIPAEVQAQYPYAVIGHYYIENTNNGYFLLVSNQIIGHCNGSLLGLSVDAIVISLGEGASYECSVLNTESWALDDELAAGQVYLPVGDFTYANGRPATYTIIWANHDIYDIASVDLNTGAYTLGDIWFSNSLAAPSPTRYSIGKAILDDIVHQVQRLLGITDKMTPEQVVGGLGNVATVADLPNAEEGAFGNVDTSPANAWKSNSGGFTKDSYQKARYYGWKFTATEAFDITKFLIYNSGWTSQNITIRLLDSKGNVMFSHLFPTLSYNKWNSISLTNPVRISAGESFIVTSDEYYYAATIPVANVTFDPRLTNVSGAYGTNGSNTNAPNSSTSMAPIDFVMAPISEVLPNTYKVERTTLNGIVDEVNRICGTSGRMSIAQTVTALQGISVQTTSTEE